MWKPSKLPPPQVLRTYRLEFVLRGHVVCLNHESSIWITCGEYPARQVVGLVSRQALRKLPPYPVSGTDFAQGHSSCAHRRITSGEKDGDNAIQRVRTWESRSLLMVLCIDPDPHDDSKECLGYAGAALGSARSSFCRTPRAFCETAFRDNGNDPEIKDKHLGIP